MIRWFSTSAYYLLPLSYVQDLGIRLLIHCWQLWAVDESHFGKVYPRKRKFWREKQEDDEEDGMREGDDSDMGIGENENGERGDIAAIFDRGGKLAVNW